MSAVATITTSPAAELSGRAHLGRKQNWVLDAVQDNLFIIAAPLIVLLLALWTFAYLGAAAATSVIIVTHIVMTVAHHLPTFIRVYGDLDLLRRFKWSFVLGPVIPLLFSAGVLIYLARHDLPVERFLYLYIMLAIWDPWHFLRQHYGFMRIYDKANEAPPALASHMDWWLCVTWFVYIMLASTAWLPELLRDMHVNAHMPIVLAVDASWVQHATTAMLLAAVGMSLAYAVYLAWCWQRGYFISPAKLALVILTFGVMYLTYTPNAWIASLAPGWSFKVGFAAVGIVHMTQYLAIVWRYNRSIGARPDRSRAGLFRFWHRNRAMWQVGLLAALYVGICLLYGDTLTTKHQNRLLMSVLLAVGFTSTLLHYYFDGFIWKVRHAQNRDALALDDGGAGTPAAAPTTRSWWHAARQTSAGAMLSRQLLYFAAPMGLLTLGALAPTSTAKWVHDPNAYSSAIYVEHMYRAQANSERGDMVGAVEEAKLAYTAMNRTLPLIAKMAALEPTAANQADAAFVIYNQSLYEHRIMPQISGVALRRSEIKKHSEAHLYNVGRAADLMQQALANGDALAHPGRERLTADEARRVLAGWRQQSGRQ